MKSSPWRIAAVMMTVIPLLFCQIQLQETEYPIYLRRLAGTAATSISPLLWKDGCFRWAGPTITPPPVLPTGIVITLVMGQDALELACKSLPNQIFNFLQPQSLDALVLVDRPLKAEKLVHCLNLTRIRGGSKVWTSDSDDSKLLTQEYKYQGSTKVIIGQTRVLENAGVDPTWSKLSLPRGCQYEMEYIQGTRWYSNEMLHLSILKSYDYFLKIDLDIWFLIPWNHFHLLSDMHLKGAVFGHTARYDRYGFACARGIQKVVRDYGQPMCSNDLPEIKRDADMYYSNFVIGRVDFWTLPQIQDFGRYLSTTDGFTTQRWTDQIFWHQAMGLLIGPDFTEAVADYTDLRCMPNSKCWFSQDEYVPRLLERPNCAGYFVHTKAAPDFLIDFESHGTVEMAKQLQTPYKSKYVYNASLC